ncbi:hypothetical protein KY284_030228 [Solanum tuberosum]|nr:hypothetical protein KY284_030228 [Solanum tuberosum]
MSGSASRATFPSITPNAGKSFGSDYQASWKKTHGKFLDDHLQALVDVASPIPIVHLEGSRERLLEVESESSSKEVFFRRLRVLDDAIPPMVESCYNARSTITVSLNKENNIATPQREGS